MTKITRHIWMILFVLSWSFMASCEALLEDDDITSGKTMFWSNFDGPPIDVFVDGAYYGTITSFYSETPSCESTGCVTISLPTGSYEFYAAEQSNGTSQPRDWEGPFIVKTNFCGTISLTQ